MSDTNFLDPRPIEWSYNNKTYTLGVTDIDAELRFQAIHERWALNRLEVLQAGVSSASAQAAMDRYVNHLEANRFAFGSNLSLQFLTSDVGTIEYLVLLSAMKKTPIPRATLQHLARRERKIFNDLANQVLERDFPNPEAQSEESEEEASTSPAAATLTPSTTASSSSSPDAAG